MGRLQHRITRFLPCSQEQGLSLVELLIAMTTMLLVLGALFAAFRSQSNLAAKEEELLSLQLNMRAANARLSSIIRHAGLGSRDSFSSNNPAEMQGKDPLMSDSLQITSFVSHIQDQKTQGQDLRPDSVILVQAFKKVAHVDSLLTDKKIELNTKNPSPSITLGEDFKRYLSFFPHLQGNRFYTAQEVDQREITLNRELDFAGLDPEEEEIGVYMVSPARIHLQQNTLQQQIFSYQTVPINRDQYWNIADNFQDLQFQYSLDGKTWWDEVADQDLQDIRKIRFWILGKSQNPVPEAQEQTFELRDRQENLADPDHMCLEDDPDAEQYCLIYKAGPFNDGYVRMLSRGEVTLRNSF